MAPGPFTAGLCVQLVDVVGDRAQLTGGAAYRTGSDPTLGAARLLKASQCVVNLCLLDLNTGVSL